MWKIKLCILILCLSVGSMLFGQGTGNEWINYAQDYYRLKVAEDGLYRVTATELARVGVPVNNIAAGRYQVFRNGQEVAISSRDTNGDGRLDYLEFFGEKNDGTSNTSLYDTPSDQPHTYYNLYTDTSTYFLTWKSTGTGSQMAFSSFKDASGLTRQPYHLGEDLHLQTTHYLHGTRFGSGFDIQSPKYLEGEGWSGSRIAKGGKQAFSLTLPNPERTGPIPTLEVGLVGVSSFNHVSQIYAGPDAGSLRLVGKAQFEGHGHFTFDNNLQWSDVRSDGQLIVEVRVVGVSGQTDGQSISYVRAEFPQQLIASDQKMLTIPDITASRGYVVATTSSGASYRVFDVTDPYAPAQVAATAFTDRLEFVFNDSLAENRAFLLVASPKTVPVIEPAAMEEITTEGKNYLIISHPELNELVDGVAPVDGFEAYRSSAAGGGFQVEKVYVDQIFDQFGYGDPGPEGIRRLIRAMVAAGSLEYVFIIGKGTTVDKGYYRNPDSFTHYVPTFGFPGSDMLLAVPSSGLVPEVPVGRLSALTSVHVKNYLDKVKIMDALPFDQLWRKNILQLSGGQTTGELRTFETYVKNFKQVAEGDYLGASVVNISKNSTETVKFINVANEVNGGVGLITFFGHSSGVVTDMEIGRASDPDAGYANQGKYPTILVNGCNAGGIFNSGSSFTFGEDWMATPNAGAVAFLANSDFALSLNLKRYSDLFYKFAFAEESTFGWALGDIMLEVSQRYFSNYGTDDVAQSQVFQTLLQGDPAVAVFGAQKPDLAIATGEISASPIQEAKILASSDSFALHIPVKNFGKTNADSIRISVVRSFADGSQTTSSRSFGRIWSLDTLQFTVSNPEGTAVEGDNVFTITIDPENELEELNESNNQATFALFIPKGNTIPLYPLTYGVISDPNPSLKWQSANLQEETRTFSLQVDTSFHFSSPFSQSISLEGAAYLEYPLDLSGMPDSTTVYWRTRFEEPRENEDTTWVEASFTYTHHAMTGWGQVGNGQFRENTLAGVNYDASAGSWTFLESVTPIQINTHGPEFPGGYDDYQVIIDGLDLLLTDNAADPRCKRTNAINAVVFDKASGVPYRPFGAQGADVQNDLVCGRLPQMIHNFHEQDVLGERRYLDSLIGTMQNGDHVVLFSFGDMAYSNWDAQLKASLEQVGISSGVIDALEDGQPVIILGQKGWSIGQAEVVTSNGSAEPLREQAIELISQVNSKFTSGAVLSTRVGPAVDWERLYYDVQAEASDSWYIDVTGVTPDGDKNRVYSNARIDEVTLDNVDATTYPFLDLELSFGDFDNQTPPQLASWGVEYELPPEGVLSLVALPSETLQEGQEFQSRFAFANVGESSFSDSLTVRAELYNVNAANTEVNTFHISAPLEGDTTYFDVSFGTIGKLGANHLSVRVDAAGPEQYTANNSLQLAGAATVVADDVNPVLDVTFDGGYILDGDIVSPNPSILIRFKDENIHLYKQDTSGISVDLKAPCEDCDFERIHFTDPKLSYVLASEDQDFEISYQPGPLTDGRYTLRVQGEDASGNASGVQPYEISFEVINESTITHFYPYPNPFSTSTRFVFTLTGSELPDEVKIQILTVSGRVVREITQDELGPLRIGTNISQYAWDGRDEFGDLLANGVYLYKVVLRQGGEAIQHRFTSGDRSFKNGFGKIYILR
ncbi:putative type IX secretion system sortase PorU2 [Marinoscillum furvescens]|uniref:CARDB protein n=1 Tax=Marinoscillum furvescens DSM 4134 TaxID=1122208 RepID=A0A3D9L3R0_MARFU|nr:C25 family cysteine peptidase [Marinoscillum furvescens]RED99440.1 CARDB protein [Marinoscillum furvescens DSM 4134]